MFLSFSSFANFCQKSEMKVRVDFCDIDSKILSQVTLPRAVKSRSRYLIGLPDASEFKMKIEKKALYFEYNDLLSKKKVHSSLKRSKAFKCKNDLLNIELAQNGDADSWKMKFNPETQKLDILIKHYRGARKVSGLLALFRIAFKEGTDLIHCKASVY